MKKPLLLCFVIGFLFSACSSEESGIEETVDAYCQTYSSRKDLDTFLSFYDEQIILEDIINGDRILGKKALRDFLDWNNPDFKLLEANSLVIQEKIIQNNTSVVKGYFTKFQWGQLEFEPMHFTTILTFNESGKIIKQVDWINYPSTLVNYNERKNSNEWIESN